MSAGNRDDASVPSIVGNLYLMAPLLKCDSRQAIAESDGVFVCSNPRVRSRRGLVTAAVCASCLCRQETRASGKSQGTAERPLLRVGFVTPNLVLGGAEYWILGLLKYCDPARIAFSGMVVTNAEACDAAIWRQAANYAPIYGGPLKERNETRHSDSGDVRRFATLSEAFGRLCGDSDVVVAWGVPNLPRYLDGLGFAGQVVLVSHGAGEWTESVLESSKPAAHRLVAVSRAAAESFHVSDVSVIHNGGDHQRCQVTLPRDHVRRAWGAGADEKLVGYVGRFSWEKNPLAAAVAARELGPPFRAAYIGGGWKGEEVKRAVLGVAPDAIFVPPQFQIGNALNALDVLLLASPSEGFSLALTEA